MTDGVPKNRLQEIREAAEPPVSRAGLADYLGIGETQVARWEEGKVLIPMKHLEPLTRKFAVSSDHLLGLDRNDVKAVV